MSLKACKAVSSAAIGLVMILSPAPRHDDHGSSNGHGEDQYGQINNRPSIKFNELILSDMPRGVCTIEQIN